MPAKDAFCNELNKRFKRLADDAWAVKWDKRLWINSPFHLLEEVVQILKEYHTQAILVVPLWDCKTLVEGCFGHECRLHPPPPRRQAVRQGPPRARKVDEGKNRLVSGTPIQVVVHQCTKLLVPTRIAIIM